MSSSPRNFSGLHYQWPVGGSALVITPLTADDGRQLADLFANIDPWAAYAYPAADLANFLSAHEPSAPRFKLSLGGETAGAAVVRTKWLRGPYLQFLAIVPGWQGRGLGSALLLWLEREARAAGERNIWVAASAINTGAIRLYERHGFKQAAVLDELVCEGRAEILMRKRL